VNSGAVRTGHGRLGEGSVCGKCRNIYACDVDAKLRVT
jgi:hypothetical protein